LPSSDVLSRRPRSSRAAVLCPRRRTCTIALALVLGIARRGRPRRSPQRLSWLGRQDIDVSDALIVRSCSISYGLGGIICPVATHEQSTNLESSSLVIIISMI